MGGGQAAAGCGRSAHGPGRAAGGAGRVVTGHWSRVKASPSAPPPSPPTCCTRSWTPGTSRLPEPEDATPTAAPPDSLALPTWRPGTQGGPVDLQTRTPTHRRGQLLHGGLGPVRPPTLT